MAKSLAQLQKQIDALQREADAIKQKEAKEVIVRIKEAIRAYGFTAQDLGFAGAKARAAVGEKVARGAGKKVARKYKTKIKFRDEAGHEWSGHGRRPQWFLDAIAAGKTADQLKV